MTYCVLYFLPGKDKTPRRTVISRRGDLTWSSEDMESLAEDAHQASTPKKQRLSRVSSREEMMVQVKPENGEGRTGSAVKVAPVFQGAGVFTRGGLCRSFGVPVQALEPHHVPERP